MFTSGSELNSNIEKQLLKQKTNSISNNEIDLEQLKTDYENCSLCPQVYKNFLLDLFDEIENIEDENLIDTIKNYQVKLDNSDFTEIDKSNLEFILYSFEESTKYALMKIKAKRQLAARDNSPGKNIGRGLVGGFLAGCTTGAYVGGTTGTVTVPGIGTVVGGVAGCIAGGAWGAVTAGGFASIWAVVDWAL